MSLHADMEELVRLGAYRKGSDPEVDEAVGLQPAFEAFLAQDKEDSTGLEASYARLAQILGGRA
jgi:flagellum-specific ATP synthase